MNPPILAVAVAAALATAPAPALAGDAPPGAPSTAASDACVACHGTLTPGIVSDWQLSTHSRRGVGCPTCHGDEHRTAADASRALLPTPDTCAPCHAERVAQFKRGKHARAWAAVRAIPSFHHGDAREHGDPSACAECHRIGTRTPEETAALRARGATHGMASCDACHTRHLFSRAEAREPEACRTCHGGGEHLQWDAWSQSKHGIRYDLQQERIIDARAAAPYCQLCHMPGGDHAVRTPWGSLGLRLPLPEDRAWAEDRSVLFRALGVLDASGAPGPRMRAVEEAGIAHLDRIAYQNERYRLTNVCRECHGAPFVREQLDGRDRLLRDADRLCADAVREAASLFEAGLLPAGANGRYPDLVSPASAVERGLAAMFFEDRARLLATAFHMSPRAVVWRAALARDLDEVRRLAAALRSPPAPRQRATRR